MILKVIEILQNILIKKVSDLNMCHEKMSDFASFLFFGFTLVIKSRHFDFESHWNTLIYFDKKNIWCQIWICAMKKCLILFGYFNIFWWKKDMLSDLNISHGKMTDFVSFPLLGFTLVIKLRNSILKVIKIL